MNSIAQPPRSDHERWYSGITRYQWLVLLIASLGWIFDIFEGQIFVASMQEAMPSLVPEGTNAGRIGLYNSIALGAFLLGGALGGIVFGALSDRIGRKRTMSLTILFYSLFTCLSAFSMEWWHLAAFRFLVALGVGGEWAVASALVAEVFPKRARARVGAIFHASSVLGTLLAVAAGVFLIGNPAIRDYAESVNLPSLPWRAGFAIGVLPAFLIIWIRTSLREPDSWQAARERQQATGGTGHQLGSISELFSEGRAGRTVLGVLLAAVGLATFWGVHIYGKNLLPQAAEEQIVAAATAGVDPSVLRKRWEMLGMFLVTIGGGFGLLSFGPLCEQIGRRWAFAVFHIGGLVSALVVFHGLHGVTPLLMGLPVFGFLTLGMHAGYAVYFPELYPTRLRGTGTGFCFNAGRILAAPILLFSGLVQQAWGITVTQSATLVSLLFLVGAGLSFLGPETRGTELPE